MGKPRRNKKFVDLGDFSGHGASGRRLVANTIMDYLEGLYPTRSTEFLYRGVAGDEDVWERILDTGKDRCNGDMWEAAAQRELKINGDHFNGGIKTARFRTNPNSIWAFDASKRRGGMGTGSVMNAVGFAKSNGHPDDFGMIVVYTPAGFTQYTAEGFGDYYRFEKTAKETLKGVFRVVSID